MPRRKRPEKRQISPDPKFSSLLVTQFIHGLLRQGNKSLAETMFYEAIERMEAQTDQPGLEVFEKAVNNVRPYLEVKSRRVGGSNYQVPVEVRHGRRTALAIRWIIGYAKARPEHTMAEKLAGELVAASRGEGASIKKKDDTHRMAEANKAFAHFRW